MRLGSLIKILSRMGGMRGHHRHRPQQYYQPPPQPVYYPQPYAPQPYAQPHPFADPGQGDFFGDRSDGGYTPDADYNPPERRAAMSGNSRRIAAIDRLPIARLIDEEADRLGFDADLLKTIIHIESAGNPRARTGSFCGLGQLSQEEFNKYSGGRGDIFNPYDNIRATIRSLQNRMQAFQQKYGYSPSATELYLTHQQGDGGFRAHMENPQGLAWQNVASTLEGRKKGPRWAKNAIDWNIPNDRKHLLGSVNNVTSAQFMALWDSKVRGVPYEQALASVNATGRVGHDGAPPSQYASYANEPRQPRTAGRFSRSAANGENDAGVGPVNHYERYASAFSGGGARRGPPDNSPYYSYNNNT